MSSVEDPNGTVRYTVKELLGRLDTKLDKALEVLEAKADAERTDRALEALDVRLSALETTAAESRGFGRAQAAIVALLLTIAALLIPIVINFL